MKKMIVLTSPLLALGLVSLPACQTENQVQEELQDLREAQQRTGEVTQDLQQQLEEAKQEVERLEEQAALARQGVTEEVMEERAELAEALEESEKEAESELEEARKEAQRHDKVVTEAQGPLEDTVPPEVDAEVQTQTDVQQKEADVEAGKIEETIEVEQTEVEQTEEMDEELETPEE